MPSYGEPMTDQQRSTAATAATATSSTSSTTADPAQLPFPATEAQESESGLTVVIALSANVLIAVAKSVAAFLTGSAAMVAESAHSWADAGNEVFLLVANRRSRRTADETHPLGYGREAYVWSLFAALGLFAAGAAVSVTHGISELRNPEPAEDFVVGYVVLGLAFVLEGISFLQSTRQARREAVALDRDLLEHVIATSDPTLRAVFVEDLVALIGLLLAAAGLFAHEVTGSAVPDALASIAIGLLLGVAAFILINQNRRFLVGELVDPRIRSATIAALLQMPDIARVTYLRVEIVGPRQLHLLADVDLSGDDRETQLAVRLRALERRLTESPVVVGCVLSLSEPTAPSLTA